MYTLIQFQINPIGKEVQYIRDRFKAHRSVYNFTINILKAHKAAPKLDKKTISFILGQYYVCLNSSPKTIAKISADIYKNAIRHAINAYNKGYTGYYMHKEDKYTNTLPINLEQDKPGFFRIDRDKYFSICTKDRKVKLPKNITQYSVHAEGGRFFVTVVQNELINEDEVKKEKIPCRGFEDSKIKEAIECVQDEVSSDIISSDFIKSSEILKNLEYITNHEISDEEKNEMIESILKDSKDKPIRERIKEAFHKKK